MKRKKILGLFTTLHTIQSQYDSDGLRKRKATKREVMIQIRTTLVLSAGIDKTTLGYFEKGCKTVTVIR